MNERILCVDDDPSVLQAYQRSLRKRYTIEPALGGDEAIAAVTSQGPYAVVVCDMRMPGMNGVQTLARIREIAPDTVRMMLTGNADQQTALEAVNEGRIFRFMNKPCPPEVFAAALDAGLEQYRLITAEKELLSKTLSGSVKLLTDVLGLVNPTAFGRASRVQRMVREICREMKVERSWLVEIAGMLSQIGCVSVPEEVLSKVYKRQPLSNVEERAFKTYPHTGRDLLVNIPRLEEVAEVVAHQNDSFEEEVDSSDSRAEDVIVGAHILKVALDWDTLLSGGVSGDLAMAELNDNKKLYDPDVLDALRNVMHIEEVQVVRTVRIHDLFDGAVLADDVRTIKGTLLCAKGQEVTPSLRARLRNYVTNFGLEAPIKIFVPAKVAERFADEEESERSIGKKTAPQEKTDPKSDAVSFASLWANLKDE